MPDILIGCYTPPAGQGDGITTGAVSGAIAAASGMGTVISPSFLAVHPHLPIVYAVSELEHGRLVSLRREGDGALTVVDDRPTQGGEPCHVAISPDSRWVAVANYKDGSLVAFALDEQGLPTGDGQLMRHDGNGPVADRQAGPHCHQVTFDDELLTVTDLGADRIHRYVLEGSTWVAAPSGDVVLRPGTGPRHQVVDGTLRFVVGELDGRVTAFRVSAGGEWSELGSAPTTSFSGTSYPSHIVLFKGHLYVGNRGADTIGVLRVDGEGRPEYVGETATGGAWPRHFAIVGDDVVVANERSHEVTVLALNRKSPLPVGASGRLAAGSPTCIVTVT
ncbi:MAG: 6-phosphogluconolactonase [Frankiaceae bacterium]|nr:6-phosphogluconolactonase [Frankiaceae bacterium]